jgi:predicted HTH domain antitoxin
MSKEEYKNLPDVRDGLTRKERIILHCIDKIQKERGGRNAPTMMLYGRVVEYADMSIDEMQLILQKMMGI